MTQPQVSSDLFQWGPREAAVLPLILTLEGAMSMDQAVGVSWPTTWVTFSSEPANGRLKGTWINQRPDLVDVGRRCFDWISERGVSRFFDDDLKKAHDRLFLVFQKIESSTVDAPKEVDLLNLYREFRDHYVAWWRPNYVIEPLEYYAEKRSGELFGDKGALASIALSPDKTMESDIAIALDQLVEMAFEDAELVTWLAQRRLSSVKEEISSNEKMHLAADDFIHRFYWVRNNYYRIERITFDQVCSMLVERFVDHGGRGEFSRSKLSTKIKQAMREHLLSTTELEESDRVLIKLWDRMTQFKDDRKRTNLVANYYLDRILRCACTLRSVALSDARNLLPEEVESMILGDPVPQMLQRRDGLVLTWHSGESSLRTLTPYDLKMLSLSAPSGSPSSSRQQTVVDRVFRGTGNKMGKVRGTAFVCETFEDTRRISATAANGILITYMTSPEWLPAISKVAGVVTLEGGQASHAFLACTQLGKPLLIDVPEVVDSSLDGMMVELDSNEGSLRII